LFFPYILYRGSRYREYQGIERHGIEKHTIERYGIKKYGIRIEVLLYLFQARRLPRISERR